MKAMITDIKRFAVHDGDGIRTTIFFKGCPLRCLWCHNPETFTAKKQLAFYEHKCVGCGCCKRVCPYNMERCNLCGKCEEICPNDARKIYGKETSVQELLDIILLDKNFYETSNGGVTLSGGECLLYPKFCAELLEFCKKNGINTAIDTCGYVHKNALDSVIPYTDTFLYDLKAFDEDIHIQCTGKSNKIILENLQYIDGLGCKTEIRIPYVPEYNDNQIEKLAAFIRTLKNVKKVKILPYHNYANTKYNALNLKNTLPNVKIPTDAECRNLEQYYF